MSDPQDAASQGEFEFEARRIFFELLKLPPEQRPVEARRQCGGCAGLLTRVEALLAIEQDLAEGGLDAPVVAVPVLLENTADQRNGGGSKDPGAREA